MRTSAAMMLALGLTAPPTAWFAAQQAAGAATYFACAAAPPLGFLACGLGLAACLGAGWSSYRRRVESTLFAADVGLGLAAIFALANLFTLAALWLIPPCAR